MSVVHSLRKPDFYDRGYTNCGRHVRRVRKSKIASRVTCLRCLSALHKVKAV